MTSQQKKARLRKKADKLIQEVGREIFGDKGCYICGGSYSCLHHYHTKGCSSALRYDWNNLIPICAGCHHRHHNANDPRPHDEIRKRKGQDWVDELEWKRNNKKIKPGIKYYEELIELLQGIMYNKVEKQKINDLLKPYRVK